jgi:hypothetical protein
MVYRNEGKDSNVLLVDIFSKIRNIRLAESCCGKIIRNENKPILNFQKNITWVFPLYREE